MLFYFLGGNMLIEKFKIVKLFNYTDFEYNFKNKDTIFIGENGTGKTTILSIFYHVLSMNIKELLKYEFRKIIIKYKGKKDITIAYDELEKYYENYNNFFDKSYLNSHIGKKIIEIISKNSEKFKFDDSNQDLDFNLNLAIKLIKNEKIKVPVGFIREILRYFEYQKKFKNVDDYINITSIILEGYRILYFPTYRRIEEDLEDINIYDIDDDESYSTSIFKKRISRSQNNHIGELIQFGMKDVQITIDNLLDTILSKLGEISFSLYLIHLPVGMFVNKLLGFVSPNTLSDSLLQSCVRMIPIILISMLMFNLIEKPFMSLRVKYTS